MSTIWKAAEFSVSLTEKDQSVTSVDVTDSNGVRTKDSTDTIWKKIKEEVKMRLDSMADGQNLMKEANSDVRWNVQDSGNLAAKHLLDAWTGSKNSITVKINGVLVE